MDNRTAITLNQEFSDNRSVANPDDKGTGLNYWLMRDSENETDKKTFRRANHEFEAALMRRPVTPEMAYGQLGLLLGIIPPAAIFSRFLVELTRPGIEPSVLVFVPLFVLMNIICAFVGRGMGRSMANTVVSLERSSWTMMLLTIPFVGLLWGIVTGFIGGLLFFGFGAIGGFFIAAPIGAIAFTLFTIFHRLLERGTLIDRQQLLPLTFGISLTIAGAILGL